MTFDLRADLSAARCPVLVMCGEQDPVCPPAASEEIMRALPDHLGQLVCFEGSSHMVPSDEPDRFAAVLREFIRA